MDDLINQQLGDVHMSRIQNEMLFGKGERMNSPNVDIHKERKFSPHLFDERFVLDITCEVCGIVSRAPFTMGLDSKTKMTNSKMKLACGHVNVVSFVHPPDYEGLKKEESDHD